MFKNIAKRIQLFAVILAVVLLVGFLGLAVFFLYSTLNTTDETLRAAGIQGIIVSVILAAVTPLFSWMVYGFGSLLQSMDRQAEISKETRDLVRQALAEGALSDDLARKLGQVVAKAVPAAPAVSYAPQQAPQPLAARPVARPVAAAPAVPVTPAAPVEPITSAAPETPIAPVAPAVSVEAPIQPKQPAAKPAAPQAPTATTTKPTEPAAIPTDIPSTVHPIKPLGGSNKTY